MRIVFDKGFALVRQSNTEPVFTLRFEADTEENSKKYEDLMTLKTDLESILGLKPSEEINNKRKNIFDILRGRG